LLILCGSIGCRTTRQAEVTSKLQASEFLRAMATAFFTEPPPELARRPLTEDDAIDIWLARWLRVRPKHLVQRYACDPRRLYEIWEETRFAGSRPKALALLRERYPYLEGRFDPASHRRISKQPDPRQMHLFADGQIAR
jgi:hypothetical protein